MILKIDPSRKIVYLDGPVNYADLDQSLFDLVGNDIDEWVIIPTSGNIHKVYLS